ncbi:MAG: hypothetical protein ACLS4Z_10000 [Christensenellaceae bacterium]
MNRAHGGKTKSEQRKTAKKKKSAQSTLVSSTQENTVKGMMPYKD